MVKAAKNATPAGQGAKGQSSGATPVVAGSDANIGSNPNIASPELSSNPDGSETSGQTDHPGAGSQDGQSEVQLGTDLQDQQQLNGDMNSNHTQSEETGATNDLVEAGAVELGDLHTSVLIEGARVDCLVVAAKVDGFRRAGRAWSSKPRAIPVARLSESDIESLVTDPGLVTSFGQFWPSAIGGDE